MFLSFMKISPTQINRIFFERNYFYDYRLQNSLYKNTFQQDLNLLSSVSGRRNIQVWVDDKKDGYRKKDNVSTKQHLIDGFKQLKEEFKIWKDEVKEHLQDDPILIYRQNEPDVMWAFGKQEDRGKFIVTSDSDHNEGNSKCSLIESPAGYGLFSGKIDSQVPKDGKIKRSGYCNITCRRPTVIF